jgi:hypothetical protein
MFAKLRCGACGASADAGHWLHLHSTRSKVLSAKRIPRTITNHEQYFHPPQLAQNLMKLIDSWFSE